MYITIPLKVLPLHLHVALRIGQAVSVMMLLSRMHWKGFKLRWCRLHHGWRLHSRAVVEHIHYC
jgi:hypothetical protein